MDFVREKNVRMDVQAAESLPTRPLPICGRCSCNHPAAGPCPMRTFCAETMKITLEEITDRFAQLAPGMAAAMEMNPVADMLSGTSAEEIELRITRKKEAAIA